MRVLIIVLLLFTLVSCVYYPERQVTASLYSLNPWEEKTGTLMWHKARVFDGEKVYELFLDEWTRDIQLTTHSGKLAIVAFYPLGTLTPVAAFWEEGDELLLYPENGRFASALLDAASYEPEIVSQISIKEILKNYPDLDGIDRVEFLEKLYEGNVDNLNIAKKFRVPLDGVPSGRWESLSALSEALIITGVDEEGSVLLFPGVWYYLSVERKLMLTITISEDGEFFTRLSSPPKWY